MNMLTGADYVEITAAHFEKALAEEGGFIMIVDGPKVWVGGPSTRGWATNVAKSNERLDPAGVASYVRGAKGDLARAAENLTTWWNLVTR